MQPFACGLPFNIKTFIPITPLFCFHYIAFSTQNEKNRRSPAMKNVGFQIDY
ncbi:hypothetical protein HOLDEFILI_01297 [Holdemania filiformis DSM 12042]|uniref:Uncharacterized protein n=1 Tax=Holdemania filiformis DSM 12042 TaxID=545696 RepID=B9Y666_9FIRM|nr:hypothetical protein HOLDEFILI_01297 [Holdemania filiformis DSM 12042]